MTHDAKAVMNIHEKAKMMICEIESALNKGTQHFDANGHPLFTAKEIITALINDGKITFKPSTETDGIDRMVKLPGQSLSFRCHCGCNVFRQLADDPTRLKCNSCDEIYEAT